MLKSVLLRYALIVLLGLVLGLATVQLAGLHKSIVLMWKLAAGGLAFWGLLQWKEAGEYLLGANFQEGFKKLAAGALLIIMGYIMAATLAPAVQVLAKWDRPTFLKKPAESTAIIEIVPQEDTSEIPPTQEKKPVEEKPKSRIPGMI